MKIGLLLYAVTWIEATKHDKEYLQKNPMFSEYIHVTEKGCKVPGICEKISGLIPLLKAELLKIKDVGGQKNELSVFIYRDGQLSLHWNNNAKEEIEKKDLEKENFNITW